MLNKNSTKSLIKEHARDCTQSCAKVQQGSTRESNKFYKSVKIKERKHKYCGNTDKSQTLK